jgi:tyrosinase
LHESDSDPSTYVQSELASEGDFSTPAQGREDANTDLTPFWKDSDNFYNSTDAKSTQKFGYAYPETQAWKFSNTAAYRADIQKRLVQLYPAASLANSVRETSLAAPHTLTPSVPLLQARAKRHIQALPVKKPTGPAPVAHKDVASTRALPRSAAPPAGHAAPGTRSLPQAANTPTENHPQHVIGATESVQRAIHRPDANGTAEPGAQNATHEASQPLELPHRKIDDLLPHGKYLEWITNIKAKKHELGRSYNVHIFLGDVPAGDSVLYPLANSHVGTYSVFTRAQNTGCARCQQQRAADLEISGQILLTVALVERYLAGDLPSMQPEHVVPYLQRNLHWRVTHVSTMMSGNSCTLADSISLGRWNGC